MTTPPIKRQRPYLIIDGFNNFIRHFMVNEAVGSHSQMIGGVVGLLKQIYYLSEQFAPSKIFLVWETGGGSPRRKAIYPEYKSNRAKIKKVFGKSSDSGSIKDLLRFDEDAKIAQLTALNKILKLTPVCQVFVSETEADDVIGYLVKEKFANINADKIIVSSDKDFYQLLDDQSVKIYDAVKRELIDHNTIVQKLNIHPRNFALAKSMVGDTSDNINGVDGLGFKTASKRFPQLLSCDKDLQIDDIINECKIQINENKTKAKIYQKIINDEEIIRRNWKLVYLNSSTMSASQIEKINYIVDNHEVKIDKLNLIKFLSANGITISFDLDRFCSLMQQYLIYQ